MSTLLGAGRRRTIRVEDLMRRDTVIVTRDTGIGSAVDEVLRRGHGHLVVVDEHDCFVDVVPTTPLTMALLANLVGATDPVSQLADPDPVSTTPRTRIADAAALMVGHATDAVAVVDDRRHVVGLLTWTEIGRAVTSGR